MKKTLNKNGHLTSRTQTNEVQTHQDSNSVQGGRKEHKLSSCSGKLSLDPAFVFTFYMQNILTVIWVSHRDSGWSSAWLSALLSLLDQQEPDFRLIWLFSFFFSQMWPFLLIFLTLFFILCTALNSSFFRVTFIKEHNIVIQLQTTQWWQIGNYHVNVIVWWSICFSNAAQS